MGYLLVGIACAILVLSQGANADDRPLEVEGTLVFDPMSFLRAAPRSLQEECRSTYGPICGDCNTIWTCVGSEKPVKVQSCAQMSPGKPICHNRACTNSVPANSPCASPIKCTGQGYFPNPTNCSQYYFCQGPSKASKLYECPRDYAYDTYTTRCRLGNECTAINCLANSNKFVALPNNSIYYAFCLNDQGVSNPIMFRCPNDQLNHTFYDEGAQKCVFQCPSEGRFIDNEDPNSFFECLYLYTEEPSGGHWLVNRQQCVEGMVFDGYQQACRDAYSWEVKGNFSVLVK